MNLKSIKKISLLFIVFIMFWICKVNAAGSFSISVSKTTIGPGESVTLTITGSNAYGVVDISASNATVSEQKVFLQNDTKSVTVTSTGAGNIGITVTPGAEGLGDSAENPITGGKSLSVSVVNNSTGGNSNSGNSSSGSSNSGSNTGSTSGGNAGGTTGGETTTAKSSNTNLSNLGIRPNDFTGFTPTRTSYSVTVPNNVTSVEVYASKGQSGQTISGTGTKNLSEGTNTLNVIVTAEDGVTTKTYTIAVTRESAEETEDPEEPEEEMPEEQPEENTEIVNGNSVFGLSTIEIDGIELSPKFSTEVYEYTAKLVGEKETLDIKTNATEENSKIEITGNEGLKEGENIITILVTNEAGDKTAAYQIKLTKTLVDEEALAKQQELEKQEQNRKIIIICSAVAVVLVIIIILIWRHRRNKRLAEEYSIPYQGFNDDEDYDYDDENYNQENTYEKISDKFNKIDESEEDAWYNRDISNGTEELENNLDDNKNNTFDSIPNENKDNENNEDDYKQELRKQYLSQSFDNDMDFDEKPRKRHSKGKRFK